jgi:predicted nucleic acid-binding protein
MADGVRASRPRAPGVSPGAPGGRRFDAYRLHQNHVPSAPPYYDDAVSGTIVYLDICALKRPFDDARSERIRREAEAVARIFERVDNGSIQLVASPAHRFENDRNPREDRRLATALWLQRADRFVDASPDIEERARLLAAFGFGPLDALHLALAEKAEARWFVTTDDRLLRRAVERRDQIKVEVVRPDQLVLDEESQE